jgi:ABC-2 type transport system permease protein
MMFDLHTMIWKEWREMNASGDRRSRLMSMLVALLLLSVIWPLQQGDEWLTGGAVVIWTVAPLVLLPQIIADVFAGERERHTLETLLASRLPDRAILFGKIITPLVSTWIFVQLAMLVALIPVAISTGAFGFYQPDTLLTGLVLSFLTSLLIASAGVLISLRASSIRQAQQWTGVIMLSVMFLPIGFILLVTLMPESVQAQASAALENGDAAPLVLSAIAILLLLDFGLVWLADRRFKRNRLILD